jgi:hypothetical protein
MNLRCMRVSSWTAMLLSRLQGLEGQPRRMEKACGERRILEHFSRQMTI